MSLSLNPYTFQTTTTYSKENLFKHNFHCLKWISISKILTLLTIPRSELKFCEQWQKQISPPTLKLKCLLRSTKTRGVCVSEKTFKAALHNTENISGKNEANNWSHLHGYLLLVMYGINEIIHHNVVSIVFCLWVFSRVIEPGADKVCSNASEVTLVCRIGDKIHFLLIHFQ